MLEHLSYQILALLKEALLAQLTRRSYHISSFDPQVAQFKFLVIIKLLLFLFLRVNTDLAYSIQMHHLVVVDKVIS